MKSKDFKALLSSGDLRTLGNSREVITAIKSKEDFEKLFPLIFNSSRPVAMRASDVIEKVTKQHPEYLKEHAEQIIELAQQATNKELKWHLAQLLPRLSLRPDKTRRVFNRLSYWASNPNESKIVRVNSLQGMYEVALRFDDASVKSIVQRTINAFERQRQPSLSARARKLRKQLEKTSFGKISS